MIYSKRVEISEMESRLYQCCSVQQVVVRALTGQFLRSVGYLMHIYVRPPYPEHSVGRVIVRWLVQRA